jgi:hypothetical protein
MLFTQGFHGMIFPFHGYSIEAVSSSGKTSGTRGSLAVTWQNFIWVDD